MKLQFTYRHHNPRLLLIFAGWGMDSGVFADIRRPGYDVAVVWDYRSDSIDAAELTTYGEVALIAWSMGVFAADRIVPLLGLPLSATVAVNGTRHPVDNTNGIPEAIFDGTLRGLNERSLMKFYRRMCGSSDEFAGFKAHLPQRGIEELADELRAIKAWSLTAPQTAPLRWDKAIVSDSDAIIPPTNQINSWRGHEIHLIPGPHLPEWQQIVDTILIDKQLVRDRFAKGFVTYDDEADAQHHTAARLWEIWQTSGSTAPIERLIEIGYGTGIFTRMYADHIAANDWQLWDLVAPTTAIPVDSRHVAGDAEAGIHSLPAESVDKIVSTSTIQWFNSLPAFIQQTARVLRRSGELILSTFGPLTFRELAAAGAKPLPYPDIPALSRYLTDAGLVTVHISDELICKRFASPHEALRHMRATGVNAVTSDTNPAKVRSIINNYPCAADGSATLTYQPIYIIATKP